MSNRKTCSWVLLLLTVGFGPPVLLAGTMLPYETVVFDWQKESVLIVNMESGLFTEIPVEVPELSLLPGPIAVDSDGAVFVYYGFFLDETGPAGSLMARLDPTLSEWTTMRIEGDVEFATDMDFKPDGNLIFAAEFGINEIDLATKTAHGVRDPRTGDFDPDGGALAVEIDSSGSITIGGQTVSSPKQTPLFRQAPGADVAERFEPGIFLNDFDLDSDGSVIGAVSNDELGTGTLYRLNFDTKAVDAVFESDLLIGVYNIEVDPTGRIVAVTHPPESAQRIVRVDLLDGSAELIAELDGYSLSDMDLLLPPKGSLWAGDADQDLDFDQLDLVRVQIAGKYLTGQTATWGEGDWDGAPGGTQGNPPSGNSLFVQLDIILALAPGHYLSGPYATVQPNGQTNDNQTSVVYNAGTGQLAVDAPAGIELTSINIDSAAGIFTGDAAQNLGGSFDNDADGNIFKATFGSSFGSLTFGNVAQRGLSEDFLLGDLSVIGSLAGGGDLGNVDLIYVPEPSGVVLLVLGILAVVAAHRSTSSRLT